MDESCIKHNWERTFDSLREKYHIRLYYITILDGKVNLISNKVRKWDVQFLSRTLFLFYSAYLMNFER